MISATDGNDLPVQFSVDRDTFYIFRDTDAWEWKGTFLTTDGFVESNWPWTLAFLAKGRVAQIPLPTPLQKDLDPLPYTELARWSI